MSLIDNRNELENIRKDIDSKLERIDTISKDIIKQEKNIEIVSELIGQKLNGIIDSKDFSNFIKKPYTTLPNGKNSIFVIVPKIFKGFQVGWLYKEDENYYIYELNQYSSWLGDVPKDLLDKIEFTQELKGTVEGNILNFESTHKETVKKKLGKYLTDFTENTARITRGNSFEVISEMIENGCLPFKARKVLQSDIREPKSKIKLREYQKPAQKKFFETGAVGVFYPTGSGKSFISLDLIDRLEGQKLILVPTKTLIEQWNYYIENFIPHTKDEITISTYQGFKDIDKEYALTIYDECQRLPANTFSRLGVINTKYRLGLSASPHREDNRESYIFALTGFPVGLNWSEYMKQVDKKHYPINVHLVQTENKKIKKLQSIFDSTKKTFVFCDSIELGNKVSNLLKIPHIHGATNNRIEQVENNHQVVMSRVGDLGLSVKNLQRIIEIDFLFGSRQQELQRTGRLLHSESKDLQHDIIMTNQEFSQYNKRLWALREKGFEIKVIE